MGVGVGVGRENYGDPGGQGGVDSAEAAAGGAPVGSAMGGVGSFDTETDGERKMEPFLYQWGLKASHIPGVLVEGLANRSPRAKPNQLPAFLGLNS